VRQAAKQHLLISAKCPEINYVGMHGEWLVACDSAGVSKEIAMSLHTPQPETQNHDVSTLESKPSAEPIFRTIESQDGAGTERAHIIAIWTGLFIFAIVVSQFGRPSRAREAEFLRASTKIAALGKPGQSAPSAGGFASARTTRAESTDARLADEKELTPAIYVSHKYGVAWQYPRTYVLRKGANANLDLYGHPATESAFALPGGAALATVIIPARVYAGTDFQAASLTARVNARISEDECGQFRRASSDTGDNVALSASPETVGSIDFAVANVDAAEGGAGEADATEVGAAQVAGGTPGISTREKFYHVFENEACYEFAMRVSTSAAANAPIPARVDKDDVFDRLSEILTSVTVVPVRPAASPAEAHGN
jgi:hypothetical protein